MERLRRRLVAFLLSRRLSRSHLHVVYGIPNLGAAFFNKSHRSPSFRGLAPHAFRVSETGENEVDDSTTVEMCTGAVVYRPGVL